MAASAFLVSARGETGAPIDGHATVRPSTSLETEGRLEISIPEVPMEVFAGLSSGLALVDVAKSRVIDEPGKMLRTEVTLSVLESYFGEASGEVVVQLPGGETAQRRLSVAAAPNLVPGTQWLVFLGGPVEGDARGIVGLARGCYAVGRGADGPVIQGHLAPSGRSLDGFVESAMAAREAFLVQEVR